MFMNENNCNRKKTPTRQLTVFIQLLRRKSMLQYPHILSKPNPTLPPRLSTSPRLLSHPRRCPHTPHPITIIPPQIILCPHTLPLPFLLLPRTAHLWRKIAILVRIHRRQSTHPILIRLPSRRRRRADAESVLIALDGQSWARPRGRVLEMRCAERAYGGSRG